MGKINRISASQEELEYLIKSGKTEHRIVSTFPADKPDCPCQIEIRQLKADLANMSSLKRAEKLRSFGDRYTCPRAKEGAKFYQVHCNNCGEIVAECYSTDPKLQDYFDFHYICRSELVDATYELEEKDDKGKIKKKKIEQSAAYWQGAMAINISPIDLSIGIECACGHDTRDFRANLTMNEMVLEKKVKENQKGKEFGKAGSKFKATEVLTKKAK